MKRTPSRIPWNHRFRSLVHVARTAAVTALLASTAVAGNEPAVTDLSAASPGVIEAEDITQALAVSRGTRIEASAPPTLRLPIFFEFNSAILRPDARALLEKVGAALASSELETFRFSIEGHTDAIGSDGYNRSLSTQRAQAVKAFLIAQGVPGSRLGTIGHGESVPVAANDSDSGRRRNRRVELINLGAGD